MEIWIPDVTNLLGSWRARVMSTFAHVSLRCLGYLHEARELAGNWHLLQGAVGKKQ